MVSSRWIWRTSCRCVTATVRHWPYTAWQAVRDELDGAVIPGLPCQAQAGDVLTALTSHGLAAARRPAACPAQHSAQVRVTGWDPRLLRRRLAVLLAGVDDLSTEWAATAELTLYHYDRHAAAAAATGHEDPDLDCHVSTDVETALRRSDPLPHTAPAVNDIGRLQQLIHAATDRYEELIAQHTELAENVTTRYRAQLTIHDHDTAEQAILTALPTLRPRPKP